MLIGVRHTGLVVANLGSSVKFFEALGFKVVSREVESGLVVSTIVGIADVRICIAKLRAPDGSMIELLQYLSHPDLSGPFSQSSNRLGCSHIALSVRSIEDTCKVILKFGGSLVNPPIETADGSFRVAYCHSPDGLLIEVVQQMRAEHNGEAD